MKKHLGLMLAAGAMAGAMAPGANMPATQQQASQQRAGQGAAGTQTPQGGIGTLLGHMLEGGYGRMKPPHHRKNNGYSVAEGARRKRRYRNKLRSKGRFRGAVR